MEIYLLSHSVTAFICYYLAYCAKHDLPELNVEPIWNFLIGLILGWFGIIIVLFNIFYKICKCHSKGE